MAPPKKRETHQPTDKIRYRVDNITGGLILQRLWHHKENENLSEWRDEGPVPTNNYHKRTTFT